MELSAKVSGGKRSSVAWRSERYTRLLLPAATFFLLSFGRSGRVEATENQLANRAGCWAVADLA